MNQKLLLELSTSTTSIHDLQTKLQTSETATATETSKRLSAETWSSAATSQLAELKKDLDAHRAQLKELTSQKTNITADLASAEQVNTALQKRLDNTDAEYQKTLVTLNEYQINNAHLQERVDERSAWLHSIERGVLHREIFSLRSILTDCGVKHVYDVVTCTWYEPSALNVGRGEEEEGAEGEEWEEEEEEGSKEEEEMSGEEDDDESVEDDGTEVRI